MPQNEVKIIDPRKVDNICIVFADDKQCLFPSAFIRSHTNGNWNHVMWFCKESFYSQDPQGFRKVSLDKYLKPQYSLKFFKFTDLCASDKLLLAKRLEYKVSQPWWKRRYDFIGIFGQFFGRWIPIAKKIQSPWANFCSEEVREDILLVKSTLLSSLPANPSPSDLNNVMNQLPEFTYLGHWFVD